MNEALNQKGTSTQIEDSFSMWKVFVDVIVFELHKIMHGEKERRKNERKKERMKQRRKDGKKEGWKEGRTKEGRKEGRNIHVSFTQFLYG